jgi:hypothetical protein
MLTGPAILLSASALALAGAAAAGIAVQRAWLRRQRLTAADIEPEEPHGDVPAAPSFAGSLHWNDYCAAQREESRRYRALKGESQR